MATCSEVGCEGQVRARGWCIKHWSRWRTHGDPAATQAVLAWREFLRLCAIETDDCVEWPGRRNSEGYLRFYSAEAGRWIYAHREALRLRVPEPPGGALCLHTPVTCLNPACFNYRHLRWGDDGDNTKDRILDQVINVRPAVKASVAARKAMTHCRRGHEFTPENTYITNSGTRRCRICTALKQRERRKG